MSERTLNQKIRHLESAALSDTLGRYDDDSEWADVKELPRDTANAHGIVALVNAYPALREAIEQLQRERDEAQAEAVEQARLNGLGSEREARLRALVAQQQALLARVVVVMDGSWDVLPPGEQDALAEELRRAVLAQEVP